MSHDQAYLQAEKKIEQARRSGATDLNLYDMKLTELPESINQLVNLLKLDLGSYPWGNTGNQFSELPESLRGLPQLQWLGLRRIGLTSLPEWMGQLKQLRTLHLSGNPLLLLPEWLEQLTLLEELSVGGCELNDLPESLGNISTLREVCLGEFSYGGNPLIYLPNCLRKLRTLDTLIAIDCNLTMLPNWINELTSLARLHLQNNKLIDLPPSLAQLKNLKMLDLEGNLLNPELAATYKEGLVALKAYLRAKATTTRLPKSLHKRKLKVFLCYASQDKPIVHKLYQRFIAEGWIEPWLDAKKLLPGQDWQAEIKNAVETADNVIIFLSNTSINKDGFIQKELRLAKDIALEKSEGSVFLIPLRLDDCEVPRSLQIYQWANYFGNEKEQTYSKLLESLKLRLEDVKRKKGYTKKGSSYAS